jgi:transposase
MRVLDYGALITESVAEIQTKLKRATKPLVRRRLRFLLLLKQHKGMSRAVAGKKLGLLPTGSEEMWQLYKSGGMERITDYPFKGKHPYLSEEQKEWLKEELQKDCTQSLAQACQLVKEHTSVEYCISAMHYVFKSLCIKKKTGRPSHVDKDEEKAAAFKKKTSPASSKVMAPRSILKMK